MLTTNQLLQQGRYRIVIQLGQNGIGIGYEALDTVSNAHVLLKEIRVNTAKVATLAQIEARKADFAEKAGRLMQIKHDSILVINDFFSDIDNHYLVAELTDGNAFSELLDKKKSPFPVTDVMNWADRLLDALNYLHSQSTPVIHGEIKPQTIKLLPNGRVKLQIFHLIKSASERMSALSGQTFDAAILPYLPLEQIWEGLDAASKKVILTNFDDQSEKVLEQPLDSRSDLYAVAATLYHLITAQAPADALTRSIEILEGKSDPLVAPSQLNSIIPPPVSDVLMKAMEIKREDRFSSASIMRQVLRSAAVRSKEAAPMSKPVKTEDDAVLEIPAAQRQPNAPTAAPKKPEIFSEQSRQLELIKRQLREAEARRLEAEQRAAQAEKRLQEAAHQTVVEAPGAAVVAEIPEIKETSVPKRAEEKIAPTVEAAAASSYQPDEFSTLFSEPQKQSGSAKKFAAAAVVMLLLGGIVFGVWTFMKTKSAQAVQSATTNTAMPEPTVEAPAAPIVEATPAPSEQAIVQPSPTETASPTDAANPVSNSPAAVKPKVAAPTPQTAQVKKPTATPARQTDSPKKVTLDDLLKDN